MQIRKTVHASDEDNAPEVNVQNVGDCNEHVAQLFQGVSAQKGDLLTGVSVTLSFSDGTTKLYERVSEDEDGEN